MEIKVTTIITLMTFTIIGFLARHYNSKHYNGKGKEK
mgnify:CR=1 FL=1